MEKLIVFKRELIAFTVLVGLLFSASILSSCGSSSVPEEEYEAFLAKKESVRAETITSGGDTLFKLPNTLINDCYLGGKRDYCLVLRKVNKDGKTYLQFVRAEIIDSNDDYTTVKRLSPDDAFLAKPQKLLPQLADMNKLETRKRFLSVKKY